jgi:DNA-binding CsgD family transcriptional regulator
MHVADLSLTDDAPRRASKNDAPISVSSTFADSIEPADIAEMLRWLMIASDDDTKQPMAARQRKLLEGIAELIAAAAWVWLAGIRGDGEKSEPVVVTILDGGWASDEERLEFFRAIGHSAQELVSGVFGDHSRWPKEPLTCSSEECVSAPRWRPNAKCSTWVDAGFEHVLVSVCTLDAHSYSGAVFYRRLQEPPYGKRERAIVHAMFQQVDWMHRSVVQAATLVSTIDLSQREREVIMRVLAGESRKTIATTLHVSLHTVADHLKQIYRKLGVKTRAGLMAKFIQGPVTPLGHDVKV